MKSIFFLLPALLTAVSYSDIKPVRAVKPDLTVKASSFRIDGAAKKIYFKVEIGNIGNAACNVNGTFTIQTYLSDDAAIGNDIPSGGRIILTSFTLEPGKIQLLNQEYYISYQSLEQLEAHPYCVIEIYKSGINLESNYENNKAIYKHGFPRKKGEGLGIDPGDLPIKLAPKEIDLKLLISDVTNELITEPETGKQYKEYTYTATIINIGNINAVIDLEMPISFQYWTVPSCTDTSGMTSSQRPTNQHVSYLLEPQQSFVLPFRKTRQKPDAVAPLLVEMIYNSPEKNKWNNFACLQN